MSAPMILTDLAQLTDILRHIVHNEVTHVMQQRSLEVADKGAGSPRYLTPQQVAEIANVKTKTVRAWIFGKKLKAQKLGRFWRIDENDLRRFIAGSSSKTNDVVETTVAKILAREARG